MNKAIINEEMSLAYDVLESAQIVQNGTINKTFRGQISSFGAAVSMGSLLPAIAFFSEKGNSSVERNKLMYAVLNILKQNDNSIKEEDLFSYASNMKKAGKEAQCKENIINAAIALKLAMNLYKFV